MKQITWMIVLLLMACGVPASAGPVAPGHATGQKQTVNEEQLQKLQNRMLDDSGIMALIRELQHDPELQTLLGDPSFLQAITTRDMDALADDPRFLKLFSNPRIKEIIKRVEAE